MNKEIHINISSGAREEINKEIDKVLDSIFPKEKKEEPKLTEEGDAMINDAIEGLCTFMVSLTNKEYRDDMKKKCVKLKKLNINDKGCLISFMLGKNTEFCRKFSFASMLLLKESGE